MFLTACQFEPWRSAKTNRTKYGYDALGRLNDVERLDGGASTAQTTLGYDPAGYRRSRVTTGPAWPAEFNLYLGEWVEKFSTGETKRLIHATGIDDVMAEVTEPPDPQSDPTPRYLLNDGAGNVLHTSDGGATLDTVRYTAFGTNRSGTPESERGFAGRPTEGATGLLYLRNRHYHPATGMFLQPDPLGVGTDHAYAYAANNPFVYSDPLGLLPINVGAKALNENLSGTSTITVEGEEEEAETSTVSSSTAPAGTSGGALSNYAGLAGNAFSGPAQPPVRQTSGFSLSGLIIRPNDTFVPGVGVISQQHAAGAQRSALIGSGLMVGAAGCAAGGCAALSSGATLLSTRAGVAATVHLTPKLVAAEAALVAGTGASVRYAETAALRAIVETQIALRSLSPVTRGFHDALLAELTETLPPRAFGRLERGGQYLGRLVGRFVEPATEVVD